MFRCSCKFVDIRVTEYLSTGEGISIYLYISNENFVISPFIFIILFLK